MKFLFSFAHSSFKVPNPRDTCLAVARSSKPGTHHRCPPPRSTVGSSLHLPLPSSLDKLSQRHGQSADQESDAAIQRRRILPPKTGAFLDVHASKKDTVLAPLRQKKPSSPPAKPYFTPSI